MGFLPDKARSLATFKELASPGADCRWRKNLRRVISNLLRSSSSRNAARDAFEQSSESSSSSWPVLSTAPLSWLPTLEFRLSSSFAAITDARSRQEDGSCGGKSLNTFFQKKMAQVGKQHTTLTLCKRRRIPIPSYTMLFMFLYRALGCLPTNRK